MALREADVFDSGPRVVPHFDDAGVPVVPTNVAVDVAGASDTGRRRRSNEDHFCVAELTKVLTVRATPASMRVPELPSVLTHAHLMLVADGVGGNAAGEVASELAVRTAVAAMHGLTPWFLSEEEHHDESLYAQLSRVLELCDSAVRAEAQRNGAYAQMATTLTMALVLWPRLYVAHVGDSRCYRMRDGILRQITTDHTMAERMIVAGVWEREEFESSQLSHVLWNAIGGGEGIEPEVYGKGLYPGDAVLVCSDGLTNELSDDAIAEILSRSGTAAAKSRALIAAANAAGGSDNVTVVVAQFRAA